MAPFPLVLSDYLGHWESYIVYVLIGFAFGAVLEMSGFANSLKLAHQFYFKEQTVLKVMFTGIVVAMLLVFLATGLGLLDYNLIWVNPTYLWPGILGGLIMGVGFILGGFCPGTSLVAAATLKLDGIFFVMGVFFGIFLFGESVGFYEDFWYSSYMGRYTLMELFDTSTGIVVLGVVIMALMAFFAAEQAERIIGKQPDSVRPQWRYYAAAGVIVLGVAALVIGQPTNEDRWNAIADEKTEQLDNREVQIHPAELLDTMQDQRLITYIIDVRSESDYNLFHIWDAHHLPQAALEDEVEVLLEQPANTVFVVVSNDETAATEAWRYLVAESVPNVYILEGGINNWLATFSDDLFLAEYPPIETVSDEQLAYGFDAALGARYPVSFPDPHGEVYEYETKIVLTGKRGATGGGCG